jgi:hypothetical protein
MCPTNSALNGHKANETAFASEANYIVMILWNVITDRVWIGNRRYRTPPERDYKYGLRSDCSTQFTVH